MNIFILSIIISVIITVLISIILKLVFKKKASIYAENNDVKSIKNIKSIKIVTIITALILSFFISLQVFSLINIQKNFVYDLYGNAYSSLTDIPLYDEYGNEYYYQLNADNKSSYIDKNMKIYNSRDIYLTKGGYIVFLKDDRIISYNGLYETVYDDGEHYYAVIHPHWNKDGDLIVDSEETLFGENNIIITKEEQLEYQKEKGIALLE